jgi:hypothetical protein
MEQLKITRDQIRETDAYKNLTKIQKVVFLNRNNFKVLEHGVNLANYKGLEAFEKEHNFTWHNKEIIKELLLFVKV